jgi:hypothetical protein
MADEKSVNTLPFSLVLNVKCISQLEERDYGILFIHWLIWFKKITEFQIALYQIMEVVKFMSESL